MRRKRKTERKINPDLKYDNTLVAKLVNYVMRQGKKSVAEKVVYGAFDIIRAKVKKDPLEYLRKLRFHRQVQNPAEYGLSR